MNKALSLIFIFFLLPISLFASRNHQGVDFHLRGKIEAYQKNQNSYQTPLDYGAGTIRSGADNREYQRNRSKAELEYLIFSNALHDKENTNTRKWIGYFRLEADFNDPDQGDDGTIDHKFKVADGWIRYAPVIFLGIKVGKTSIVPTVNPRMTTDFVGDFDEDFVLYGASGLSGFSGISVDLNYHYNQHKFQLGAGELQGMSKGGQIASGGASPTKAITKVYWGTYKSKDINLQLARQYARSSLSANEERAYDNHHILQNWAFKYGDGVFQPFVGEQKFWGDKTNTYFNASQVVNAVNNVMPSNASCSQDESKYGEFTLRTIGIQGEKGSLSWAFERTYSDTPAYCKRGNILPITEIDSMSHSQISYEIEKNIHLTIFSHSVFAKKDQQMRKDIKGIEKDIQTLSALPVDLSIITKPVGQYNEALKGQRWSNTTSSGVSFKMRF